MDPRSNLLHRRRPRKDESEEDDEKKGAPKVPIPKRLTRILPEGVRKDDQLQIAHDPRQIPPDGVPDGLRQRVGRRPESLGSDAAAGALGGGDARRCGSGGLLVGGWRRRRGRSGEVGGDERGGGDGNGGACGAGGTGGEDGGGADVDEILYLVYVRLGGGVEGDGVAVGHLRRPRWRSVVQPPDPARRRREEKGEGLGFLLRYREVRREGERGRDVSFWTLERLRVPKQAGHINEKENRKRS